MEAQRVEAQGVLGAKLTPTVGDRLHRLEGMFIALSIALLHQELRGLLGLAVSAVLHNLHRTLLFRSTKRDRPEPSK